MKEKTHIANTIELAREKAKYDAEVKKILSNKHVLAWILKWTASEFRKSSIEEIIDCIEGEPEVGTVPIHPGKTNLKPEAITGLPTEDIVPNEGDITYDIRFYAMTPFGDRVKLIINVEAQKKYHVGYDLVTRAIFYCARMISAQKDTEFTGENFDDIKKVYSIWICMDTTKAAANTITEYKITKKMLHGIDPTEHRYDLMSAIMVCLGDKSNNDGTALHEMLSVLLSEKIRPQEKADILDREYNIPMERGDVEKMCNLSDIIEEKGIEKGTEKSMELISILLSQGRTEDAMKVTKDEDYRNQLYKEFGIM